MTTRRIAIWAGFAVLGGLLVLSAGAMPAGQVLDVAGIVKAANGEYFAIVRGYGMVKKGDTIPFATDEESGKILIVSIDRKEVKTTRIDVVKKESEPKPELKPVETPKPRRVYQHRDPFWPVGHEPSA